MNIVKSLIRTYFMNASLDVFFNKVQGTISSGLKNLDNALNATGFNRDDIVQGMKFSRIETIGPGENHSIFYDCKVAYIDNDPQDSWVEFSYQSVLDKWEDEPEPILETEPDVEEGELEEFEFFI